MSNPGFWQRRLKSKSPRSSSPPDRLPSQHDELDSPDESMSSTFSMSSGVGMISTSPSFGHLDGTYSPLSASPSTPKKDWEQNYSKYLNVNDDRYPSSDGSSKDLMPPPISAKISDDVKKISFQSEVDSDESGDGVRRRRFLTTDVVVKPNSSVHGGKHFMSMFANKKHTRRMQSTGDLDTTIRSGSTVTLGTSSSYDNKPKVTKGTTSGLVSIGPVIAPRNTISSPSKVKKTTRKEHKMLFTEMRNQFSTDTATAYLGEEKSVQKGKYFANLNKNQSFGSLSSVTEDVLELTTRSIQIKKCNLTPVEGPETWADNQRYLMAPAILASCPKSVVSLVASMTSADLETAQNHDRIFDAIVLGNASIAQVLSKGLVDEDYKWSEGMFILRQNYLLEQELNSSVDTRPIGFAFLQNATIRSSDLFQHSLRLDYHQNVSSSVPRKSVIIKLTSETEFEKWKVALTEAARLKIEDLYEFSYDGKVLGKGRYATIYAGRRRKTRRTSENALDNLHVRRNSVGGILKKKPSFTSFSNLNTFLSDSDYNCAIKIVDKDRFWERVRKGVERADSIVRETSVQAAMLADCTFQSGFLQIRSFFETSNKVVLELELLEGIDLYHHVSTKGLLAEVETANIMYDILNCIKAMQQNGVAHRDVKPGNILMANAFKHGVNVKLGDFGMATFVGSDKLVRGRCGTPGYVAPEILSTNKSEGYENAVDMFSAGVVMYILLCGYEPFYGENEKQLIQENKAAKVEFPKDDWKDVSIEGRDLVEKMLESDPKKRISPSKALLHPWITRRVDATRAIDQPTERNVDEACVIT